MSRAFGQKWGPIREVEPISPQLQAVRSAIIDSTAPLTPYTDTVAPPQPGSFRVLEVRADDAAQLGFPPGKYLVNQARLAA